mgnify:FL=1
MEENNDFEKYDGHEESIETLLGTNEKSSSMTSRERVDVVLENEGADALSKFGVPKNLGKKAIKKDGGTFMPTHGPTQKMAKNYSRNKLAQGLDKIDEVKNGKKLGLNSKKNPTNSKNSDKTSNRINNAKNKRNIFSNRKFNGNKTNSEETESDQKQESKQSIKDKIGSKISGKNKTNTQGKVDSIVKQTISGFAKKALIAAAPFIIGFILLIVLIFFVIELILGPIMEAWGYIDEAITGTANFSEKLTNFYSGFGFQDSKEAFYDELDDLCDRYGCSNDGSGLDVPLLLSTLFYTEGMGYDTAYDEVEALDAIDASVFGEGSPTGLFNVVRGYLRNKFDEAQQTVDENGLTYNAGKIYRLRKLARNQFHTDFFGNTTREGEEKTMGLGEFLKTYGKNIGKDIVNLLEGLISKSWNSKNVALKELYAFIVGSEYSGSFFDNAGEAAQDVLHTITQLIGDIFYGILDITDISISLNGVTIKYKTWKYDEDNYKNYLMKYYFEHMPEFKSMIKGLSDEAKENRKEQLYNDILSNKKLFEDIFLQYQNSSSENYVESCLGAINQTLVNNLNKPVDIAENFNVSFDENYSYGIVNGKNHNGVDLNTTTAGVNLGSNVYSVANGKIVSIEDSNCNDKVCGKSIKISHDINVDNETFKFFTIYSNVDAKNGLKVDSTVVKGDTIGTINNSTDNTEGLHFIFLDANSDANGVAIDPTNLFVICSTSADDWMIHQSSISKAEFATKLQNYCTNNTCGSSMQMFVNNADLIYDTSKKYNVSPELVVVRAVNEGFSPGNNNGSNNYWGIGCTNSGGINACYTYSSLSEGIKSFASISPVKNSQTASEMMSTYAYIGDYWYNPGSSARGGCYYYPYINGYMLTSRSNVVAGYCSTSKTCSGSDCGKTTSEDQDAYSKWQVNDKLIKNRKEIFGY